MKNTIIILSLLFPLLTLSAQDSTLWELTLNPKCAGLQHAIAIEKNESEFVVFGQSKKGKLYIAYVDKKGEVLSEKCLPFKHAYLKSVRLISNDQYLLSGYKILENKHYPSLWTLNELDGKIRDLVLDIPKGEGSFNDVTHKGNIFITGKIDQRMCLLQLDDRLHLKDSLFLDAEEELSEGNAIAFNNFSDLFVVGYSFQKGKSYSCIWKFSSTGAFYKKTIDKQYPNVKGLDFCILNNQEIITIGVAEDSFQNQDLYFLKSRLSLSIDTSRIYPAPQRNIGNSVIQTPSKNILVAGEITSFNARTSDFWMNWLDRQNGEVLLAQTLGKGQIEKASQALNFKNGDFLVSGIFNNNKIKLFYFQGKDNPCDNPISTTKQVDFFPVQSNDFILGKQQYDYKGYILSKIPLSIADISIKKQLAVASKAPEQLLLSPALPTLEGQFCYFVEKRLTLDERFNAIQIKIGNPKPLFNQKQEVFVINKRPKLFLLSIGIPYNDLNYTDEDARDFASIYKEQEGILFEQVNLSLLNEYTSTSAAAISKAFLNLKDLANAQQINQEDVLMVFISSHGEVRNNTFFIPGSDRREDDPRTRVDFEREITQILEKINCKKIIFLDACHSGSGDRNTSIGPSPTPFIKKITNTRPGIVTFYSSSEEQLSFEQDSIKNGLFTEALVSAFVDHPEAVDRDKNAIITVKELDDYLRKKVPELVHELFEGAGRTQHPGKSENSEIPDDFPIFYINKQYDK